MSGLTKRIKAAVSKSSLSYEDIEIKLGLPERTVEKWVRGTEEPDTATVKALAGLLGVSADSILFGVEQIGEMKAMFPNDVNPQPTPLSDWRFLVGAVMLFTGAAGFLMMYMMYSFEISELSSIFDILGWPAIVLVAIAAIGALICVLSVIIGLHTPKAKKNNSKKKDKK